MKKVEKILIEDRPKIAEENIRLLKSQASQLQTLISQYNAIEQLENLTTPEQALAFLSGPVKYFEQHLIADTGISFNSKVTPSVKGTCTLFGIDYDGFILSINKTKTSRLDHFEIGTDLTVSPTSKALAEAEESGKIYLEDPAEIAEYMEVQDLCDRLNRYAEKYHIHTSSMSSIQPFLGLKHESVAGKYQMVPNIHNIKELLKYGKRLSSSY